MTPADHARAMEILADAMELPAGQRGSFLDSTCIGEPHLRREIEELLDCAEPAARAFDAGSNQIARPDPEQIGAYKILEPIGEGGMAIVYRAAQEHPVRRIVALKLIKLGMDTRQFVARFEAEQQTLAMLDHPHVARVYDAGATGSESGYPGRPYFVMEYVPGSPILEYCDLHRLGIRQRLELFIDVCDAVEYAHRQGIIHRDLKDSNVLVTEVAGKAVPKVIDFGVAKAIGPASGFPWADGRTLLTELGQLIGTPEYMSPEQAERGILDIDTRSDVYSLGVLLYELLAGVHPIPSDPQAGSSLRSAGYEQVLKIIRDTEPQRPSARLRALPEAEATTIAERRRSTAGALVRELRGELEWIPLKAMRKDREQRYRSAAELTDDIRNYLTDLPLRAGPESRWYRVKKVLRRHKFGVAASTAIVLLLVGGTVVTTREAVRAKRAEARAKAERDSAQATLQFLTNDVLSAATPQNIPDAKARDQIVDAMITPAAQRVGKAFADRPLTEASVRQAIQDVLVVIGRADLALPHAEAALAIRRRELGEDHPDTIASLSDYGRVLRWLGRTAETVPVYQQVLERRRRLLGPDDPDTLSAENNYGTALEELDRTAEAEPLLKDALERRRRMLGNDDPKTIISLSNYAHLLTSMRRFADAEPFDREALERRRRLLGEDHPDTLMSLNNCAYVLQMSGRSKEAEPLYRQALDGYRRVMGEDHPQTLAALNNYAACIRSQGRFAEAEPMFRQVLERRRKLLGEDHPDTILSMNGYAVMLLALHRYDEAEALARQTVARAAAHPDLGPTHRLTKIYARTHANALRALGRTEQAAAVEKQYHLPQAPPATRTNTSVSTTMRSNPGPASQSAGTTRLTTLAQPDKN